MCEPTSGCTIRHNNDVEAGFFGTPYTVVICGTEQESVSARRKVGVSYRAGAVDCSPLFVKPFELVGEGVVVSGNKVAYCKVESEDSLV